MPIRKVRTLPGFEVKAIVSGGSCFRVPNHLVDVDIKRFVRRIISGDALKPQFGRVRVLCFYRSLNVDMRQDAVWHSVGDFKRNEDFLKGTFDCRHRLDIARDWVVAEQDIADRVGKAIEDLPSNIVQLIGWRIRLEPGAQVAFGTDPTVGEWVEHFGAEGD